MECRVTALYVAIFSEVVGFDVSDLDPRAFEPTANCLQDDFWAVVAANALRDILGLIKFGLSVNEILACQTAIHLLYGTNGQLRLCNPAAEGLKPLQQARHLYL